MAEKDVRSSRARKPAIDDQKPVPVGIGNHPPGEEKEEQGQIPARGHRHE